MCVEMSVTIEKETSFALKMRKIVLELGYIPADCTGKKCEKVEKNMKTF